MKLFRITLAFLLPLFFGFAFADSKPAVMTGGHTWRLQAFPDSRALPWGEALATLEHESPGPCIPGTSPPGYAPWVYVKTYNGQTGTARTDGSREEPSAAVGSVVTMGCIIQNPATGQAAGHSPANSNFQAVGSAYSCDPGWTLNGTMCDSPDPCKGRDAKPNEYYWVSFMNGKSPYGPRCKDGCTVYQTGPVCHPTMNPNCETYTGGTADKHQLMQVQHLATKCEANAEQSSTGDQPPPKVPPVPKAPPCAPGEGVLTTSKGTVACVPEGTMGAAKPVEQESKSRNEDSSGVSNSTKNTTKDPVTGATTVTETKTDANGNVVSTSSTSSGAGGTGDNSGDEPGQCAKEPDSPICKKGTIKDKGKYGTEQDGQLEQAKTQLTAKFAEIRTALSAQLRYSGSSGGGSLPCPAPVTVMGATISFCVADYASSLSVIGEIIVFAATIIAAIIVVTA